MKPENTKTKDQKLKTENRIIWLVFAALIVFTYFFGLTMPLVGPDEPRYAQVAREMFERGDWITPTLGGFDWFEKPALLYWLQIAAYKIFGVNEFAARFGSAIFGLGTIFSLWILGRSVQSSKFKVQSSDEETSASGVQGSAFADRLALIAASSIGLIAFSRGASFDVILTFPLTVALVCYFIFESFLQKHYFFAVPHSTLVTKSTVTTIIAVAPPIIWAYLFLFGFYFFVGIALLAKGLIGVIFPFAIVFFYHILKLELLPSRTFLVSLFWGTVLSLLVASVWYVPMYQTNGWKFVDEFFIQHHFQRFTSDKYQHYQPFWFFFVVLPLMTIPWLPFFLAALWNFLKVQRSKFKGQSSKPLTIYHSPLTTFCFSWLAVPLVFFSLSGSKLPGYILPALPAAIVLTAIYVDKFIQDSKARERAVQITAAAVLIFVIVVLQFFAGDYVKPETVKNMIAAVNAKGFADEKIVNLFTVSHNLEFYAAGRLIREPDGKLKRYDDFSVLVKDLENAPNRRILVVVPKGNVQSLLENNLSAKVELLAENGESAIVSVSK